MDVAIIGAAGTIGRQIAISLVEQGIVPTTSRLQLVGRAGGQSEATLPGLAHDLLDAHGETAPDIDVCYRPEDVVADIWVIAGGATMPIAKGEMPRRAELAQANVGFFESYARSLQQFGHGEEIVMVVTNPVELGVEVFARHHNPRRVLGMGAYLDSLRFRLEVAKELHVRRQQVSGLVLGEHGAHIVPCWSTVRFAGMPGVDVAALMSRLMRAVDTPRRDILMNVIHCLHKDGVADAYALAQSFPADIRTFLMPLVTHMSGAKTPVASAEMIARLIYSVVNGEQVFSAVQAKLEGEVYDLHGVTGVPAILSNAGIERFEPVPLWESELQALRAAVADVSDLCQEVCA